jgi:hypothetical protein
MATDHQTDDVIELGAASVLTEGNGNSGLDGAGEQFSAGISDD